MSRLESVTDCNQLTTDCSQFTTNLEPIGDNLSPFTWGLHIPRTGRRNL
nr:MAG TPA: hypothetical protein [Bacteriophage sp.]